MEASYGHIRDLPESAAEVPAEIKGKSWGRLGVDTDGDFTPYYVVPADKKKNVTALKAAMKDASELILATDPDREGESISWHLKELLKPKVKVRRIVFHEITEEAVKAALAEAARRGREPRPRAGKPPHPRSAVRLHAVAGAVEEGADRPQRGTRAERRGPRDRRAGGRTPRVPYGQLLGPRSEAARRRDRVPRDARQDRRPARRHRQGLRQQGRARIEHRPAARREERHRAARGADARACRGP